jgi:hypothetical protein
MPEDFGDSKRFECINKAKYQRFDEMLNECIVRGETPVQADEFVDFIMDYGDFAVTHKRSNRAKTLLRYRSEVRREFEKHSHSKEWVPLQFKMFRKTGRKADETVIQLNAKIRELHSQGKSRREIITAIQ